ncbi:LysR family transcriptional regulator [Vulcanimicrobium alpinum]|uniref:LysR family transcriptional regulator n=1 Tax=Vulcanimicrobium alpinum TaxID=3016050 RepID=A0AAN1XVR7_UNVUL|nr:LysR substrate-binding domain-containing protein [Vulcanimicrobium alpinum]BDE06301.1 LysR family transcriptional regulator [Vulcanimicrobium alpinum]
MFSLHQLRTFLEVARTGSVREAAEHLVVSQPAVSAALASLQRAVGAPVVERDGRGLRITPAGERLANYGRQIVALLDEAVVEARAAARAGSTRVRLAVVTTAAEQLVPALLTGFAAAPDAPAVELRVANREAVWDLLAHGEVDLVLGGRPPDDRFVSWARRPNALVVVRARQAADAPLGAATWLVREPGSGTRATTDALFEALAIAPPSVTIGSNAAILGCVRAGLGVSLLSRGALARDLTAGDVVEISTAQTPLQRDWHLSAARDRAPTDGARRFVEHVLRAGAFAAS